MEGIKIIDQLKSTNIHRRYIKFYKTIIFFGLIFLGLSMISCAVSAVSPSTYITNNPSTNTGPTISGISPASNVLNVPKM